MNSIGKQGEWGTDGYVHGAVGAPIGQKGDDNADIGIASLSSQLWEFAPYRLLRWTP
jgi:hypothetical protein